MIVSSTDVQNNFGKYLMLAAHEDIIVTRNGTPIAKLTKVQSPEDNREAKTDGVKESSEPYSYGGRLASFEEFQALTRNNEDRYEYIDGEIHLLAAPRAVHQYALRKLMIIFDQWSRTSGSGCEPWLAPFEIRLYRQEGKPNVVQPDLMMICDLKEQLDENGYYQGVPSLIVEILSEGNKRHDMVKKLDLYMCCGVKEYWIVDPSARDILIYQFENGNISRRAAYKQGESAVSFLFEGLNVPVDEVFM